MNIYFREKKPLVIIRDPVTGRPLKSRVGCLPFNRIHSIDLEMDEYFLEGCY